jgi:hypothetical protein
MKSVIDYINPTNTKFLISSHVATINKAAKKLKQSLISNNIAEQNIITVCAGHDNRIFENDIYFTNHNSFDHSAIIEVLELNLKSKYWFVMHDTCEAGNLFYEKLTKIPITKKYYGMSEKAWLNMGLISEDFLYENKNYILSLKNCNKKRAILSERVFSKLGDFGYFGLQADVQTFRNCKKIYDDNKKRIALYFPYLDFYKYQSYEAVSVMNLKVD